MKLSGLLFAAAIVVAALALVLDSPALVILAVLMIGAASLVAFVVNVRAAQQGGFVLPYLAILAAALAVAGIGTAAVLLGDRADAPGLVLLGVAMIGGVVVGALALGFRTAQRST